MRPRKGRRSRSSAGSLLIELLVGSIIALFIGAAIAIEIQTSYDSQAVITGENMTYAGARQVIDTLANRLRNAQQYQSGSTYQVLSAATASDITLYSDAAGDTVRYWLDTTVTPNALRMTTTTGGTATTTTLIPNVSSLTFTYYKSSASTYNGASSNFVTTTNANAPTSAEMPQLSAIDIAATMNINGYTFTLDTLVRLRNSPHF